MGIAKRQRSGSALGVGLGDFVSLTNTGEGAITVGGNFQTTVPSQLAPGKWRILVHVTPQGNVKARNPKPRDLKRLEKQKRRGALRQLEA